MSQRVKQQLEGCSLFPPRAAGAEGSLFLRHRVGIQMLQFASSPGAQMTVQFQEHYIKCY